MGISLNDLAEHCCFVVCMVDSNQPEHGCWRSHANFSLFHRFRDARWSCSNVTVGIYCNTDLMLHNLARPVHWHITRRVALRFAYIMLRSGNLVGAPLPCRLAPFAGNPRQMEPRHYREEEQHLEENQQRRVAATDALATCLGSARCPSSTSNQISKVPLALVQASSGQWNGLPRSVVPFATRRVLNAYTLRVGLFHGPIAESQRATFHRGDHTGCQCAPCLALLHTSAQTLYLAIEYHSRMFIYVYIRIQIQYVNTHIYIYTHTYGERERERHRQRQSAAPFTAPGYGTPFEAHVYRNRCMEPLGQTCQVSSRPASYDLNAVRCQSTRQSAGNPTPAELVVPSSPASKLR